MPHYSFDVHDGIIVDDKVGLEMPDLHAAHAHAMTIMSDYAAKPGMIGIEGGVIVVNVRDAANSVLMTMRLVFSIEHFATAGHRA